MKKVRYAVVGMGHIAQVAVLPAFEHAENSELAVLISGDPEKQQKLSEQYGVPSYSYEEMEHAFQECGVDAAYIALPNSMHRQYTVRSAKAGVHVLCEKPMAVTEEECAAMIAACEEADVRLMIAYRLHFTDSSVQAIEFAQSGELGELRYFNSLFAMQVKDENIRVKRELGGGTLYDIGVYCINAARYLFQSEPEEVFAVTATRKDPRFAEIEEMTGATMRFPGERIAQFTCSFGSFEQDQLDLAGTKGALRLEPAYTYTGEMKWIISRESGEEERTFPPGDQFAAELIYFSQCVLDGRTPEPSGAEGLADVRIIRALYHSAETGKPVHLGPVPDDKKPGPEQEIKRPPVEKPELINVDAPH